MGLHRRHPIVRTFVRGLALLLPIAMTAGLLIWIWQQLSDRVLGHVENWVRQVVAWMRVEPLDQTTVLVISILVVLTTILLVGLWFSGFVGRRIYRAFEKTLNRLPVVGAIYPHIKQITEFFFGEDKKIEFQGVVAIQYPRQGVYSIGFLTGSSSINVNRAAQKELLSVFIPSSPMPITGYTIFVPASEIIDLPLSVDEALRTVISGGVLLPDHERSTLSPETVQLLANKAARAAPEAEDALRMES